MIKLNSELINQKLKVYNRIQKKLNKNNLTFWEVLVYCSEERNDLFSAINNVNSIWIRFKKTKAGISLERLELFEEWVDDCIANPKRERWEKLYKEVRVLTVEYGVPVFDIYRNWLINHNEYVSNKQISIMGFGTFKRCFYTERYNASGRFSYKRLKEVKSILLEMIFKTFDYGKKTYKLKRKYL